MDLIAIDIGNSSISIGCFAKESLSKTEQIELPNNDKSILANILKSMREFCGPQPLGAKTVPIVVSSVNDQALKFVEDVAGEALDQNILLIGRDVPLDMKVAVENIDAIGSDRLLTASAAFEVIGHSLIVADFGTATTIDCVNDSGIYLGGVILPGLGLSARALHENTQNLPQVKIEVPTSDYGINTETAIQNGLYYGALGTLREVAERYATQLGQWPQVVACGGYSKLISQKCDFIDSLVPDLCLDGIYIAYDKFRFSMQQEQSE